MLKSKEHYDSTEQNKIMKMDACMIDAELIHRIAERAKNELGTPFLDTSMDITATHLNGCSLRLGELLNAPAFNFAHDVWGIRSHLDRQTGKLMDCFLPRYALREAK